MESPDREAVGGLLFAESPEQQHNAQLLCYRSGWQQVPVRMDKGTNSDQIEPTE